MSNKSATHNEKENWCQTNPIKEWGDIQSTTGMYKKSSNKSVSWGQAW
jgi:hypothetical protein